MISVLAEYIIDNFAFLVVSIGLVMIIVAGTNIGKEKNNSFLFLISLVFVVNILEVIEQYLGTLSYPTIWRVILSVLNYCARPIMALGFILVIVPIKSGKMIIWIPALINAIVYFTAFFSGIAFSFNSANEFQRGPLGFTCHITSAFYTALILIEIFRVFRESRFLEGMVLILCMIACLMAVVVETAGLGLHLVNTATVISCTFYYMFLNIQITRSEKSRQEELMAMQRSELMLSQIKPHFMYNTLGIIRHLCNHDPALAGKTVESFAEFLRGNMKSIDEKEAIPFERELEHAKAYTQIEMLRYENVTVEYEINDTDFRLPALSLQPIVENAIRHGVRDLDEGKVCVKTLRDGDYHVIIVSDNGEGFDMSATPQGNGNHVGMKNVRERIKTMCGGEFLVDSNPNRGTKITIKIPV